MKKHWKLIVYLLGFLVLAVTLAASQPLSDKAGQTSPPDEINRYKVPQYICEHGALPTGLEEEIRIPGYGFSYGLYNTFPYIVMGGAMRLVNLVTADPGVLLLTARLVNVLAGLAMAYVVWLLARRIFEKERSRWLFCLAVTYQPMNVFVHSYVNTDSFCMLSTALIVYGLVRLYQEKADLKTGLWLAAGVVFCALSYYSAYGYILAAIVLAIAYFIQKNKEGAGRFDWTGFLKFALPAVGIVLVCIGWWFIRQAVVLQGDFLGLRTRAEMTAEYGISSVQYAKTFQGQGISFFGMLGEMLSRRLPTKMAGTLIAAYGCLNLRPGIWFYALYALVWGAGLAGCVRRLFIRNRTKWCWKKMLFHVCMLACVALPLALFLRYCYTTDYQEQGRYLLPALVPAMYYVVKGFERWGKQTAACAGMVIVFCAFWQVFAVALPAYP